MAQVQLSHCVNRVTFPGERLVDEFYSVYSDSMFGYRVNPLILLGSPSVARALQAT